MMVPHAVLLRVRFALAPRLPFPDLAMALLAGAALGLAWLTGWPCDAETARLLALHHAARALSP